MTHMTATSIHIYMQLGKFEMQCHKQSQLMVLWMSHQGNNKLELCGNFAIVRSILEAKGTAYFYVGQR